MAISYRVDPASSYGTAPETPKTAMTPAQWDTYNTARGYKPEFDVTSAAERAGKHRVYYNPKEYIKSENGFVKIGDTGKTVDYNNDDTYKPLIQYTAPTATPINSKINNNNTGWISNEIRRDGTRGLTYSDGTKKIVDKTGKEVMQSTIKTFKKGGLMRSNTQKCMCGCALYKSKKVK